MLFAVRLTSARKEIAKLSYTMGNGAITIKPASYQVEIT
jgi:hypothetical protein